MNDVDLNGINNEAHDAESLSGDIKSMYQYIELFVEAMKNLQSLETKLYIEDKRGINLRVKKGAYLQNSKPMVSTSKSREEWLDEIEKQCISLSCNPDFKTPVFAHLTSQICFDYLCEWYYQRCYLKFDDEVDYCAVPLIMAVSNVNIDYSHCFQLIKKTKVEWERRRQEPSVVVPDSMIKNGKIVVDINNKECKDLIRSVKRCMKPFYIEYKEIKDLHEDDSRYINTEIGGFNKLKAISHIFFHGYLFDEDLHRSFCHTMAIHMSSDEREEIVKSHDNLGNYFLFLFEGPVKCIC